MNFETSLSDPAVQYRDERDEERDPSLAGEKEKAFMALYRARMIETNESEYSLSIFPLSLTFPSEKKLRYALPTTNITPIPYISAKNTLFHYPKAMLDNFGSPARPTHDILEPNPVKTPDPTPLCFPRAPTYTLNSEADPQYRRGYYYSTTITLTEESKAAEAERLYKVATPPGVRPVGYDKQSKSYTMTPVEGMIEMPAGVPFVVCVDGDKDKSITVACIQTLDSMSGYPEHPRISQLFNEVFDLTWGTANTEPIFRLDGTKLNLRSQQEKADCYNGSASHDITVEEQSSGYVQPASQAITDEAAVTQLKLLVRLAELYKLIVPLCISKQELDVRNFWNIDVNALCCGSLHSGFSGLQKNVSSSFRGGSLALILGILTGAFHVDWNDDPNGWTLLIGLFRLPPGICSIFPIRLVC